MAVPKSDRPLPPALRGTVTAPEITIPLQQVGEDEVGHPEDYYRMIMEEYSNRYLAALGVAPTAANKDLVVKSMPLKDCEIHASWASRASSVADSLTILPSTSLRKKGILHDTGKGGEGPNAARAKRQIEWLDVRPPATEYYRAHPDSPTMSARVRKMEMKLQEQDMKLSEGSSISLTREFERQRQQRVLEAAMGSRKGEGAEQEAERKLRQEEEVESLKRFLLPFAAVQPGPGGTKVLKSWRDATLDLALEIPDGYKREAILPIQISVQEIEKETHAYVTDGQLPMQMLTVHSLHQEPYKARKEQLQNSLRDRKQVRLIGLLSHFVYWTTCGHLHSPQRRLPEQHRQALFTAIHEVWSAIEELKHTPWGVSFGLPVHLLVLKRGVLWCFTTQYQNMMKDENVVRNLVFRINVVLMHLLDPENRYSRLGIFDVSTQGIHLRRQLSMVEASHGWTSSQATNAMLNRATTLTSSLIGESAMAHQTRRLLAKNVTTAILRKADAKSSSQEELANPEQPDLSREWTQTMDAPHRVKLFGFARQRLQQPGQKPGQKDKKKEAA